MYLHIPQTGNYSFYMYADDRIQVYVSAVNGAGRTLYNTSYWTAHLQARCPGLSVLLQWVHPAAATLV